MRRPENGARAKMKHVALVSHLFLSVIVLSLVGTPQVSVAQGLEKATSQVVYVPAYSRVLTQEGRSQPLASTIVVHNIDPDLPIDVERVEYYDRSGQLLEVFGDETVKLTPFQSINALVPIGSVGDGIGANFLVTWSSEMPVLPPIIEAIMVGGSGTQGISFTSRGRAVSQTP